MSPGRVSILKQLSVEPTISISAHRAAGRRVHHDSWRARAWTTGSRRSCSRAACCSTAPPTAPSARNLRFRWEYRPGSELFLVYTDERDTTDDAFATPTTVRGLKNRAFVVKINRLLRY